MVAQDPFGTMDPRQKVGPQIDETIAIHFDALAGADRRERTLACCARSACPKASTRRCRTRSAAASASASRSRAPSWSSRSILICDEPTSALDVSIQAQVLNVLLRLQEQLGLTIILISHDIRVVGHMSHEIGVMHAGLMVEQGPCAQLLREPRHAYSRALFDAAPGAGRLVRGAAEASAVVGRPSDGDDPHRRIAALRMLITVLLAVTFVFVILRVSGDPSARCSRSMRPKSSSS